MLKKLVSRLATHSRIAARRKMSSFTPLSQVNVGERSAYENPYQSPAIIDSFDFSDVTNRMRCFFLQRGFVEVHTQNRLSILAACEDPFTISQFEFNGTKWPLPQTGQMWLEYELLNRYAQTQTQGKTVLPPGFFCLSTSYRHEPSPTPGRHQYVFPMFEFEMFGGMEEMMELEKELLNYLGYNPETFKGVSYAQAQQELGVPSDVELTNADENSLFTNTALPNHSNVVFLSDFPEMTSPFWNMRRCPETGLAKKVDVIMHGYETIGSAERETDTEVMVERFKTISEGQYYDTLLKMFGKERIERELDNFMSFTFPIRSGGGIGVTRMIRSMSMQGLLLSGNKYTDVGDLL